MNGFFLNYDNTYKTLTNPNTPDPYDPDSSDYNDITDNLLDYTSKRRTTFKWQWDIMRKKIKQIT